MIFSLDVGVEIDFTKTILLRFLEIALVAILQSNFLWMIKNTGRLLGEEKILVIIICNYLCS